MHYYQFNIADYRKDTTHLSMLEHGAYRQLLDWLYLSEQPIPRETEVVMRRLSARTEEERLAIQTVLNEMFELTENGYIQTRCIDEIAIYHCKAGRARDNGKLGGRPKKTKVVILDNPDVTQTKANSLTKELNNSITIKESLPSVKKKPRSQLPDNFIPTPAHQEFARQNKLDLEHELVKFKFHHEEKGTLSGNWNSSFSKWLHNAVEFRKPAQAKYGSSRVQEARLDVIDQIFGGLHHEHVRQVKDITPSRPDQGYREDIPETLPSVWDSDAG